DGTVASPIELNRRELTQAERPAVWRLRWTGWTVEALARLYAISPTTISRGRAPSRNVIPARKAIRFPAHERLAGAFGSGGKDSGSLRGGCPALHPTTPACRVGEGQMGLREMQESREIQGFLLFRCFERAVSWASRRRGRRRSNSRILGVAPPAVKRLGKAP